MTSIGKLAFDWHDLLTEEGVTQKQFSSGVRHAVKTCRFFPKLADVLEGVSRYRERPPEPTVDESRMIEAVTSHHDLTPEEIERNKARVKTIRDMLAGRMTMDDAVAAVDKLAHIETFGTHESKQNRG